MFGLFKKRTKAAAITDADIDALFAGRQSAVLMFGAGWCGACKMQKPIMHDLADHHKGTDITIGLIDTDHQNKYTQQFSIQALPTIIVLDKGEPVFKHKGLMSRRDLETIIKRLEKTS